MLIPPIDVAVLIRDVNASNEAVEDQCLRACQVADIAARSARVAELSATAAMNAVVAHRTTQAERPRRRAPLPRQVILALITVALDGVACYFAAQALDGSQDTTLIWTGLFLAVLAGGEFALDFYRDRNLRVWRALAIVTGVFVVLLGLLRFWFLATIGTNGLVPATIGAILFTAVTAGFLCLGYRGLRVAETPQAWRARRAVRKAWQAARAARATADRDAKERDRLVIAYLGQVRRLVLKTYPVDVQVALESAVRSHLSDRSNLDEGAARPAVQASIAPAQYPHPRSRHLKLQVSLEPPVGCPHTHPSCHPGFRARHHHRSGFSVCDASYGSARSDVGTPARTGHHIELPRRGDPGLLAGAGPAQRSGARCACSTPIPSD
jgi:hypothetical protein